MSDRAGSQFYVSPEVLKQSYSFKSDCWSAGVLGYELLTGRLPFLDEDDGGPLVAKLPGHSAPSSRAVNAAILSGELDFSLPPWDTLSPGARDLIQQLLTRDPEQRPTAREALQHPWLSEAVSTSATLHGHRLADPVAPADQLLLRGTKRVGLLSDSLVQRLQRYGSYTQLRRFGLNQVAQLLEAEQPTLITPLWDSFRPVLEEGGVSRNAVIQQLLGPKWDLSEPEIHTLLACFHVSPDGLINRHEWLAAMTDWAIFQEMPEWATWVERVFASLDAEHSGVINKEDLEAALCTVCSQDDCATECAFPDTIPAVLREVGHYEDASRASIDISEFRQVLADDEEADRLDMFESRRVKS